eukprot:scaffold7990_cov145-Amphora_coffeaeformis.AAC.1
MQSSILPHDFGLPCSLSSSFRGRNSRIYTSEGRLHACSTKSCARVLLASRGLSCDRTSITVFSHGSHMKNSVYHSSSSKTEYTARENRKNNFTEFDTDVSFSIPLL